VFMIIAGANFALHFTAWRSRSFKGYLRDSEFKTYVTLLACIALVTAGYLYASGTLSTVGSALRQGVFQTVSISTTTGFTTAGYHTWPSFLPVLLLFASFIGGCAGSTGGGLKVIRVLLLVKQGGRLTRRAVLPVRFVPMTGEAQDR